MSDLPQEQPKRRAKNTPDPLAGCGFRPEYRTLSICTTCMDLFDPPSPEHGNFARQTCRCAPRGEPRWPGYDFNERARLCDCCGRHVLRSGSRWSVWFCPACKDRIVSLDQEFGFALIPIGRHSLMNGFGLSGGADEAQIERFLERFGDMGKRMDILHDGWKPAHLRGELERLGLVLVNLEPETTSKGIPLVTYLRAVAEEDRTSGIDHRLEAFRGLADCFEVREVVDPNATVRAKWIGSAQD